MNQISGRTIDHAGNDTEHKAVWNPSVLHRAIQVTTGKRNEQYGEPWENHQTTADLWRTYIKARFKVDLPLKHFDVCEMNILQKASRVATSPTELDHWVDQAGFAGNAGVCIEHDTERNLPGK